MAVKLSRYAQRVQKGYRGGCYSDGRLEQRLRAGKITKKEMEAIKASKKE